MLAAVWFGFFLSPRRQKHRKIVYLFKKLVMKNWLLDLENCRIFSSFCFLLEMKINEKAGSGFLNL
jgi:hypothetical protein